MEILEEQCSVIQYSNEFSNVWNEIDYYRSLPIKPTAREYILKGRHYHFLTRLWLDFENMQSMLFNRETKLSFMEAVVHAMKEEGRLNALGVLTQVDSQTFGCES